MGNRGKNYWANREDWGVEIVNKLSELGTTRRKTAQALNLNYSQFCNIINGNRPKDEAKHLPLIISYINQLCNEAGKSSLKLKIR